MRFLPTPIAGAFVIEPELLEDERGYFARVYCAEEFAALELTTDVAQCSVSFNHRKGTLRGMHYQATPHGEVKLVRCTMGAIHDVLFDTRPASETFMRWTAHELSAENRRQLYVPEGVAHGFLTLADDTEVHYQISTTHEPTAARGVRWNDPAFAARWPFAPVITSPRDAGYPDFAL